VAAPQRTARIEDDVWNPAQERAQAEGATLAALMRAAVQRYADGHLTRACPVDLGAQSGVRTLRG
jgi:hypothetical protein